MSIVAIITARGGSKRIPGKNIKIFNGKPMLAYAIESAIKSNVFDEVMVSTDSLEIAEVAKKYGANVPFMRSDKTASDFATTYDALEEVICEYGKMGREYDDVCCIYPCVPFLTSENISKAYSEFTNGNYNATQSVCRYSVPIEWAMQIVDGVLVPNDEKLLTIRSQDLTPKYYDAGMFYFCKTDVLLTEKTLVPSNTHGFVVDASMCQDIDTEEDWLEAEIKYEVMEMKNEKLC